MVLICLDQPQWDCSMCALLEEKLRPALSEPDVIFDLGGVTFMDLQCLMILLRTNQTRVGDCGFPSARIVAHSGGIKRLLERAGTGNLWPIFDNLNDAMMEARNAQSE